jgi:exosortase A-associated hydrolase 2
VSDVAIDAFFLGRGIDRRFALLTAPERGKTRGAVLFIPPFGEEMNKARRMVSLTARALAEDGYATLQIDLHGCGDSAGDLADASWSGWIADVTAAYEWLHRQTCLPVTLWAMRVGALLASAALPGLTAVSQIVFWQPTLSGSQFLRQFLRLKTASSMLAGGSGGSGAKALLAALAAGQPVEVAGYMLPPAVARPIDQARLEFTAPCPAVTWFEVSAYEPATLTPASLVHLSTWRRVGVNTAAVAVSGPQFWQTQEIEECPELTEAMLLAFRGERP